jgi:hypothetical protein
MKNTPIGLMVLGAGSLKASILARGFLLGQPMAEPEEVKPTFTTDPLLGQPTLDSKGHVKTISTP